MSGLLTQIVRRQTLMMTQRRHDSSLLLAGPPINKVSNKEKFIALTLFLTVPMIYPIYIMANLQSYNGSNRSFAKKKKSKQSNK